MKFTLRKRRTAPSSWKLKAFNYNTVIIMKRTGWKSDFSSEKSKTIRSEKRMKREKKRHFSERAQPTRDFKNADDADDRLISMNICHHQSKNLALDRWKTKIQMSSKCTEVTRAPLRENPGIFLSYKFTLKKTVSDRKPSALISSELLQVYVVTQCL